MLELRYAGCADCLNTAKSILRNAGFFVNRDYRVEFHQDHKGDRIYSKRPDYLKVTSGAILYNPSNESWIDFYTNDRMKCVLCGEESKQMVNLVKQLRGDV